MLADPPKNLQPHLLSKLQVKRNHKNNKTHPPRFQRAVVLSSDYEILCLLIWLQADKQQKETNKLEFPIIHPTQ